MPIQVTCAGCGVTLSTPDTSAGKRGKCPKCGGVIEIPHLDQNDDLFADPSILDDVSEEEMTSGPRSADDRRPCPSCGEMIVHDAIMCRFCGEVFDPSMKSVLPPTGRIDTTAWSKVRGGLRNIYVGIGVLVGTVILGGVTAGIMTAFDLDERSLGFVMLFLIAGLLMLGAGIGIFVGLVRCTNVPQETRAHGFMVAAVACFVGNFLLSGAGTASDSEAVSGIGSLLWMVGWILFILFIRRSAIYLGDHELSVSVRNFILFMAAMLVGAVLMGVLSATGGTALVGILAIGFVVGGLFGFIWFLRLIQGLVLAIDQRVGIGSSSAAY